MKGKVRCPETHSNSALISFSPCWCAFPCLMPRLHPVLFAQCNLLLSVWRRTLYDARHASVMWLQTADTESSAEFISRLAGPPVMLLSGLLSNHRSSKRPRKVANPCTYPTSCHFPPLPNGQVFHIITFEPRISPGTLTQGKKRARLYETIHTSSCDNDDENSGNSNVNVFLLLSGIKKDRAIYSCLV